MKVKDKRQAILQALLELVAERGLHDAPMSLVAKRSKASPGVIYHYFPSKDELIRALYFQVERLKGAAVMKGYREKSPPAQAFKKMWLNAYHFYHSHPKVAQFLDQYESSPLYQESDLGELIRDDSKFALMAALFHTTAMGGPLKNLPLSALMELSWGVASRLATRAPQVDAATLEEIADACWAAIAA